MTEFSGLDDIDFESAEFSRRFFVKADNKRWAYDILHARSMEFLLSQPPFSIQFAPSCVMAWRSGRFSPEQFEQAALVVHGLLSRIPDYVRAGNPG